MQRPTGQRTLSSALYSCHGLFAGRCRRHVGGHIRRFPSTETLRHAVVGPSLLDTNIEGRGPVAANAQKSEPFDLFDIDGYIESSRKHLRTVYDIDSWEAHRSPSRYARHMLGLPNSRMLRGMAAPLLYVLGVAAAFCLYQHALQAGMLPAVFPSLEIRNKEIFGLTSFALSLLLVFRTNASYERWDSARKMWGLVLNRSRDIVRQGLGWIPSGRSDLRSMLCRWVPAFSKALMCHLRKGEDLASELEGILLPHEIEGVLQAKHRPNYILQVLTGIIQAARLPNPITLSMEQSLTSFEDCLGGCERILRTPIPLCYSRHTSRFITIWLTLLPFTLLSSVGWGTIPMCGIISFLLLGIKEITVTLEEPFSILALEAIAGTVVSNVRELEATHSGGPGGNGLPASAAAMIAAAERAGGNGTALIAAAERAGGNGTAVNSSGSGNGNSNGAHRAMLNLSKGNGNGAHAKGASGAGAQLTASNK